MEKQMKTWRTVTQDDGEKWWLNTVERSKMPGDGRGNPKELKILNITQDKPYLPRDAK